MENQRKAGAVLSYLSLFLNSAISIIYTPIMLNLLGQSEYGIYSLSSSLVGYFAVLNFGLGNAVIRYTAKYKALEDEKACSSLYGMFLIMYGVLGAIVLVGGMLLTLNSHKFFPNSLSINELSKLKILMGVMVINISVSIGLGIFSVIVLAHEKFVFEKIISLVSTIIIPIIVLPILILGYGSIAMVITTTTINFIAILSNMYYCFKVLKIKITFKKVEISLLKEILVFSFYIFLNLVIGKIYWSTDQIILGIYTGTVSVAVYTIGSSFMGYFSGFAAAISNVFLSKVTIMVTKSASDNELSDLFIRVGRVQYIIISFILSGFIVFGKEFIYLWVGLEYSDSFIIAIIILIPSIIPLIQSMGGVIIQAKNLQKFKSIVYFLIAIANIFASIIFVQIWGAIGCAVATAIAFIIGNIIIMNVYYWNKLKINIKEFWRNILHMSMPFTISLVFGLTLNKLVLSRGWIDFIIKTTIFSMLYAILMWFGAMNKYEKNLFVIPIKKVVYKINKRLKYKVN